MVPSSWHAPGMVLCCTAATGLGMWHQQHRTGLCSSMAGVQHTHHHHPASVACGVQDCGPLYLGFRMGSEHRTCDARTVHDRGCALRGAASTSTTLVDVDVELIKRLLM